MVFRIASWMMVSALLGACTESLPTLVPRDGAILDSGADASVDVDGAQDAALDAGPPVPLGRTLAAGTGHTCALVTGRLWCWGESSQGQLASMREDALVPVDLSGLGDFVEVTGRGEHVCGRTTNGEIMCWGESEGGQAGAGRFGRAVPPAVVTGLGEATQVSAGYHGTCAVDRSGTLWCWGQNREGQLAQGDPPPFLEDQAIPLSVSNQGWRFVAMGQGHGCAIDQADRLFCWGRNTDRQLGIGAAAADQRRAPAQVGERLYRHVAAGQSHSCAIDRGGSLFCFGDNAHGQLGVGGRDDRPVPAEVLFGDDSQAVTDVDLDTFHSCAIRGGSLYCWGRNVEGQLGLGHLDDVDRPARVGEGTDWQQVAVGRFHTCASRRDGSVWCTGENGDGRLGTDDLARRSSFTRVTIDGTI